jgi:biopolymer transport protein ExbD
MARKTPEVPAASLADIAFMLLIFFLVTTTMDVDSGLERRLPPFQLKKLIRILRPSKSAMFLSFS